MNPDFRIYGTIRGLSSEDFEAIRHDLPFDEVSYKDGVLDIEHESSWLDLDDILDSVKHVFGPEARGGVDFIDNQEWKLTRYVIKSGGYESTTFDIDNVLEGAK